MMRAEAVEEKARLVKQTVRLRNEYAERLAALEANEERPRLKEANLDLRENVLALQGTISALEDNTPK